VQNFGDGANITTGDIHHHHGPSGQELRGLLFDYAQVVSEKAVAEGFIREMAGRVAADKALDFEGMKQAVRNAIDIYEKEIAGGIVETNVDAIVDAALKKAKAQVDKGQSGLARATLRRAADAMRRDEQERRDRYEQGARLLYQRERDIALSAYDGEAAAQAVTELAEALHGYHHARLWQELKTEEDALYEFGRDRGSNVHLIAAIALDRRLAALAQSPDEKGYAHNSLGIALRTLGARESGTARLEEAVAAYRAALQEWTRERVPLDWAMTQNNLGLALWTLGERESGTARLEEAVAAYRAALEERTRARVPLDWAATQNNLGLALWTLGERESGPARLEEAVAAYRAALEEFTRERVPLDWATTQNNLGNALWTLGERESGTARLEEAVAAYRAALEEFTRERVPLDWATTQNNLGNALGTLGERESGTARLEEAVAAYRAALEERTRERVPLYWAASFGNQGGAMRLLAERTGDGALARQALARIETALETLEAGGHEAGADGFRAQIPAARALVEKLGGGG
jgi:exonuclease VII small subunit